MYIEVKEEKIHLTKDDIDDIMVTALEGGITYWCERAEVPTEEGYLGEYASEQIALNGTLKLYAEGEEEPVTLTEERLLHGLCQYILHPHPYDIIYYENGKAYVDTGCIDAEVADMIIQYALFDEIVYG